MKLDEAVQAMRSNERVAHQSIAGFEGEFVGLTCTWAHSSNAPKALIQTELQGPPTNPLLEPGQSYVRFGQFVRVAAHRQTSGGEAKAESA